MKTIDLEDHWLEQIGKLRAWITGWRAARQRSDGTFNTMDYIPGEDVLRLIEVEAREKKPKKNRAKDVQS